MFLFGCFYDDAEILEAHDFDLPARVDIGRQRLGLVDLAADLDRTHRRKARKGHAAVAHLQFLVGGRGHTRRVDPLFERKALPGLGAQGNNRGDERKQEDSQDDYDPGYGAVIAESEVDGTAAAPIPPPGKAVPIRSGV